MEIVEPELAGFLADKELLLEEQAVWGEGTMPMQIAVYLTAALPPLAYVTSVRAVVFRDEKVLVVWDADGSVHVVPGGRRDAGEGLHETLRRELLEETGWAINRLSLFAVVHFHHLAQKPAEYPYPYPDFLQLIYRARATEFRPGAQHQGGYEVRTGFRSMAEAGELLPASQKRLLEAARRDVRAKNI